MPAIVSFRNKGEPWPEVGMNRRRVVEGSFVNDIVQTVHATFLMPGQEFSGCDEVRIEYFRQSILEEHPARITYLSKGAPADA